MLFLSIITVNRAIGKEIKQLFHLVGVAMPPSGQSAPCCLFCDHLSIFGNSPVILFIISEVATLVMALIGNYIIIIKHIYCALH